MPFGTCRRAVKAALKELSNPSMVAKLITHTIGLIEVSKGRLQVDQLARKVKELETTLKALKDKLKEIGISK